MKSKQYWIDELGLIKHPEGGYFREILRSDEIITSENLPNRYDTNRNLYTSIFFLIDEKNFSAFHKLNSDELWIYNSGSTTYIVLLDEENNLQEIKLGENPDNGEHLQFLIPKHKWFAASVKKDYSLISCVVVPGFNFEDFQLADREELLQEYPQHKDLIVKFTRK